MKAKFSQIHRNAACSAAALVAVALALSGMRSLATESTANVSANTYGSGKQFKTTVERRSQGDLSAEDLHQASLLTSQFLTHVDQANANLQTAKVQLEAYRALVDTSAGVPVTGLENDIQKLSGELQSPGAADSIRAMWDNVTGWFRRESGQAHQVTNSPPGAAGK